MLFDKAEENLLESDKERNLYFKIFGAYIFNEFYQDSKLISEKFFELIKNSYIETCRMLNVSFLNLFDEIIKEIIESNQLEKVHVDFDHHINRNVPGVDNGELADILISSPKNFIAIEVKYKEDWDFYKDIKSNRERIKSLVKKNKIGAIQILLITENKWLQCYKHRKQNGSNYIKLINYLSSKERNEENIPFVILFWENVREIITNDKVRLYLDNMLKNN